MSEDKPLVLTKEDEIDQLFERSPILTSQNTGWDGVSFRYMSQPAYETPEICTCLGHSITIFTHGNYAINADRKLDGRFHRDSVVGGDIVIIPANIAQKCAWDAEGDFIILGIDTKTFARAIEESKQPEQVQLIPYFSTPDPLVLQIGLAIKNALQNNPLGSRLYAETMVNALSVHLLQHYSARKPKIKEYLNGLSKLQLKLIIEYIEHDLDKDLGLNELAELLHMSPHYFCYLFKKSMKITPHQYVIKTRVHRAKELLLTGKYSIAQVAFMVGFANQSHLNRHFKKLIGVTPGKIGK
ncbi:DNA-binding domain-containing protein, AraC-type [Rivularia sp. PCC 7116]|uniref:helix-turn-helix transcriptional regulator n=1 Tax=Rivularia sp. PCC 7116 TaxID=373994 RepID=UPI00029EEF96|nr:AraC family transcriptional regulator [Rivularia sp. PCC 7116]AFY57835.1 DNA-binding domain-containing protein, AraC-type [Rivularia sp. PCC 7116]